MSIQKRGISRREFLKLSGAGLAISAGLPLVSACGSQEGGQGGSQSASLTATYMKSGTYDVAAKNFAKQFEKNNDAQIQIEAFPYAALRQNNTNAVIAGGCDYNVVSGSYYLANIYSSFRPIGEMAQRDNYSQPLAAGLWEQSEYYNGEHIGVPYGPDAYGLMYRTDLWKNAGLSWPSSWDEFLSALETLEAEGTTPFVFAAGAPEQLPALFFATYDGYFVNDQGRYELNTAKATDSIEYAEQLLGFAPDNVTALSIDEAQATFMDGEAAVLYSWPSFIVKAASDPETSQIAGNWQVGEDPQPGFVWLSLWQMYMTQCTENTDAAWEWMKFWSKPENDKALFTEHGVNPVLESTYQDQQLLEEWSHYFPGEQKNLAKAMNPPLSGEAQDFLASTLGEVFTGNTSAEEAVRSVNEKWADFEVPEPLLQAAQRNDLVQAEG